MAISRLPLACQSRIDRSLLWLCILGNYVFLKAWKEGKQYENSQYLAHCASSRNSVTECHIYMKRKNLRDRSGLEGGRWRGAKKETEDNGSVEPYSEGDSMSRRDQGARKAQAGVMRGSEPQGAGLFLRALPVSGPRCTQSCRWHLQMSHN